MTNAPLAEQDFNYGYDDWENHERVWIRREKVQSAKRLLKQNQQIILGDMAFLASFTMSKADYHIFETLMIALEKNPNDCFQIPDGDDKDGK